VEMPMTQWWFGIVPTNNKFVSGDNLISWSNKYGTVNKFLVHCVF